MSFLGYSRPRSKDTAIVIAWFSPVGWRKPRQNLEVVLDDFLSAGMKVYVAEMIMPGAEPLVLPSGVSHMKWENPNVYFAKENLWNMVLGEVNHDKLVFLDGDIRFDKRDWLDETSDLLERFDIIQPFEICVWLDRDGTPFNSRISVAKALSEGADVDLGVQHPGFAWAGRRKWLKSVGGFYDTNPLGGGDSGLAYALWDKDPHVETIRWFERQGLNNFRTRAYHKYKRRVMENRPRIGYSPGSMVTHLWHGSRDKRLYTERERRFMPDLEDGDYPVERMGDGLLRWKNPDHNERAKQYFLARNEDE